jgi:hypothetical protein
MQCSLFKHANSPPVAITKTQHPRTAVQGYIAHKQKVLVVSKDAAFPPPSASWWQDPF